MSSSSDRQLVGQLHGNTMLELYATATVNKTNITPADIPNQTPHSPLTYSVAVLHGELQLRRLDEPVDVHQQQHVAAVRALAVPRDALQIAVHTDVRGVQRIELCGHDSLARNLTAIVWHELKNELTIISNKR